jgi:hypothetical protein
VGHHAPEIPVWHVGANDDAARGGFDELIHRAVPFVIHVAALQFPLVLRLADGLEESHVAMSVGYSRLRGAGSVHPPIRGLEIAIRLLG